MHSFIITHFCLCASSERKLFCLLSPFQKHNGKPSRTAEVHICSLSLSLSPPLDLQRFLWPRSPPYSLKSTHFNRNKMIVISRMLLQCREKWFALCLSICSICMLFILNLSSSYWGESHRFVMNLMSVWGSDGGFALSTDDNDSRGVMRYIYILDLYREYNGFFFVVRVICANYFSFLTLGSECLLQY